MKNKRKEFIKKVQSEVKKMGDNQGFIFFLEDKTGKGMLCISSCSISMQMSAIGSMQESLMESFPSNMHALGNMAEK